jgi:hypothetical protein
MTLSLRGPTLGVPGRLGVRREAWVPLPDRCNCEATKKSSVTEVLAHRDGRRDEFWTGEQLYVRRDRSARLEEASR